MPITKQIEDATLLIGKSIRALDQIQSPEVVQALVDLEEANRMLTGVLREVASERTLNDNGSQLKEIADKLSYCLAFKFTKLSVDSILEGLLELSDRVGHKTLDLVGFRDRMRGSILLG